MDFCDKHITSHQRTNWPMVIYLLIVHVTGFIGFCLLTICKWETLVWCWMLLVWSEIGVTGGLHRLWSHRSYKAHWTLRTFYMLLSSIANQGSIYHWVRDHRVHHKYSETDADPHNVSILITFSLRKVAIKCKNKVMYIECL